MISRYTLPEMGALWSEETKFQKWLDVEIAVCEVHAEMGTIPREALKQIKDRAKFSVARINEIEKTTDHDVIAFTTNLAESIGDAARFVHFGLTSSDVVDTANALLLRDACDILLKKIDGLMEVLKRRAIEFKNTPQVGRTHGIHAEPTSFGLTFALWYDEMRRKQQLLIDDEYFREELRTLIVAYLQPLPRNVKRFLNRFRVNLLIAHSRGLLSSEPKVSAQQIGKWLILVERWPLLSRSLSAAPEWMESLEEPPQAGPLSSPMSDPFMDAIKLLAPVYHGDEDLREFVRSEPPLGPVLFRLVHYGDAQGVELATPA